MKKWEPVIRSALEKTILDAEFEIPKDIGRELHLVNDFGFDSLNIVEFFYSIEEIIKTNIPPGIYDNLMTIGDVSDFLDNPKEYLARQVEISRRY